MRSHAGRRTAAVALLAALSAAIGSPARARPSAPVSCAVSVGSIAFGIYDPLASAGDASTATLRVNCTAGPGPPTTISFGVEIDAGSSGNFAARTMLSGANALDYNIYWDVLHTLIVGDGTGGSHAGALGPLTLSHGPGVSATATLYGYVPARQDPVPGNYSDVLTVTVVY